MSEVAADLAAILRAETRQFDKAMDDSEKKVKNFTQKVQELDKSVSGLGKKGSYSGGDGLSRLTADWNASVAKLKGELNDLKTTSTSGASGLSLVNSEVTALASRAVAAVGPVAALTAVLGATAIVSVTVQTGLFQLAKRTADAGAEISNLAKKYKVSAEEMQAAQILAEQSGKSVTEVIREQGATLDLQAVKLRKTGAIMSGEMVAAGKAMSDQLVVLNAQWQVMLNQLGSAVIPQATAGIKALSDAISENRGTVEALSSAVGVLANYFGSNLVSAINQVRVVAGLLMVRLAPIIAIIERIERFAGLGSAPGLPARGAGGLPEGWPAIKGKPGFNEWQDRIAGEELSKVKGLVKSSGGGGGGAKTPTDELSGLRNIVLDLNTEFRKYQHEIDSAGQKTSIFAAQEKLLSAALQMVPAQLRAKAVEANATVNVNKALADTIALIPPKLREQATELIKQANAEIVANEEKRRSIELNKEYIASLEAEARSLQNANITRLRYAEILKNTRPRYAETPPMGDDEWITYPNGSRVRRERPEGPAMSRDRVVTMEEQVFRQQIRDYEDKMRQLAGDLTYSIRDAIHTGFQEGVKAGFQSLLDSLLQMIENVLLKRLEQSLTDLLTRVGSSGGGATSGGGIFDILRQVLSGGSSGGGAAGGIGGAIGGVFAGGFASGGLIPMGQWGNVHAGESVVATPRGAQVIPSGRGDGGNTYINNFYVQNGAQLGSRDTQAQIARQVTLMQQKVALAG